MPTVDALEEHDALAGYHAPDLRADLDDLAGDLVPQDAPRPRIGQLAGAVEQVVIADSGGLDADEHVARPGRGPRHLRDDEPLRPAKLPEDHGLHGISHRPMLLPRTRSRRPRPAAARSARRGTAAELAS